VTAVRRGSAASEAVLPGDVDAVILDVWLPAVNGVDLCQAWRRAGVRTPILMLTARTERRRPFRPGAAGLERCRYGQRTSESQGVALSRATTHVKDGPARGAARRLGSG
jgi:DNA-binding response OmpR family regulator